MLTHLADLSVRALALALIASVFAWRRSAAVQHAVGTIVVCGMLALFALGSAWPRVLVRVLRPARVPAPQERAVTEDATPSPSPSVRVDLPAVAMPAPVPFSTSSTHEIDWIELGYGSVTLVLLLRFLLGAFLAGRLVRHSTRMENFRESERIAVPLTAGWLRPAILLPLEWRDWERAKLNAVLAHEGAHVRRRDPLIAAIAGINRCLFWFHPLAWWLERRLALLAELACDEACVVETGDAEQYASLLLEMTLVMDASRGRLRGHALSMAAGSHIARRVHSILKEGRMFSRGVTRIGWAAIAMGGIPLVWAAGAVTLEHRVPPSPLRPPLNLSQRLNSPKPPVLIAQARQPASAMAAVSTPPAPRAQFEVASIRPSVGFTFMDKLTMDPGRLEISSVSIQRLMEYAFQLPQKQVDGPSWLPHWRGPHFDISAKLPQGATRSQVPEMLKSLLVDRFKLVYHLEHREQNVDVLVVAKNGLKLEALSASASASTPEPASAAQPNSPPSVRTFNGILTLTDSPDGGGGADVRIVGFKKTPSPDKIHYEFSGTLQGLSDLMVEELQRPVVDMTGLKGLYHLVLDVRTLDPSTAPPKSIAEVEDQTTEYRNHVNVELQKVGLQLEMRKVPVEYVVADRVEQMPTDN